MDTHDEHNAIKPLRILIVGAGIGGLAAALALRQQGHDVDLFEQSKLSQETGAAIHTATNANGLLRRLGLRVEDYGAVECAGMAEYFPDTGALKYRMDLKKTGDKLWAHPWHLIHRAHLHTALRQMVLSPEGKGRPARLHLASRVKSVDPETASITFEGGAQTGEGEVVHPTVCKVSQTSRHTRYSHRVCLLAQAVE